MNKARRRASLVSTLALLVLFFAFLNAQRFHARLDLTADASFTLSPASRKLAADLSDRVFITYYLSDRLARLHPAPRSVIDFLRSLESVSRGKVRVTVEDPLKSGKAAAAESLGVLPQNFRTVDSDQSSVATVYSGIVVEYLGRTSTIPFVFSTETLEYDLLSRIRTLSGARTRSVGVMVASAHASWAADYQDLSRVLSGAGFSVSEIRPGSDIPSSLSALFIFGGAAELDGNALRRVERYLLDGGNALFAVDGVNVDAESLAAAAINDSLLLRFLEAYGVRVSPELVLDESSLTIPYQKTSADGSSRVVFIRYPHWVSALPRNSSATHPVTARFAGLDLYWPSPLSIVDVPGVSAEAIVKSTDSAWRMDKDFVTSPDLEDGFYAASARTKGSVVLAVSLSGVFPGYFSSGAAADRASAAARPARILVVGDADFAGSLVQYTDSVRNLEFAVAAADWLSRDDDLALIRNRIPRESHLDALADPRMRSRTAVGAEATNIFVVPAAVILYGVLRALRRRKDRFVDPPR